MIIIMAMRDSGKNSTFCRVWKNQDTPREMGRALLVMVVVVSVEQRREAPALPTD